MKKKNGFTSNINQKSTLELRFPLMLKIMTDEETKKYHSKKLCKLSLKSIGEIPELVEPTYEQKIWVINKMKSPLQSWRSFT